MHKRSTETNELSTFLRQWSAQLPQLEKQLADPAHPLWRTLREWVPTQRSSGGPLDAQQAAALAGLCLFIQHAEIPVVRSTPELAKLRSPINVEAVLDQIAQARHTQDPTAHLFEMLLAQSPAGTRRKKGVYFTPQPLVRFIVQSVDVVLRKDLGIKDGLDSSLPPLRIVDPACGAGVFLMEMRRRCEGQSRELVGIDLMPACCAAVRLISADPSPAVYCANALLDVELGNFLFQRQDSIPIILGNPPYSNFGRQNQGTWIRQQLVEYKTGLDEQKINLDDDFIKFLRWGQYWIDQAGHGLLAMVTNNTYLRGLTHRQMRSSLLASFDRAYFVDLQGDRKKTRSRSRTTHDENVFDIQQGVAVCVLAKTGHHLPQRTAVARLTGSRIEKLTTLNNSDVLSLEREEIAPEPPYYFLRTISNSPDGELYAHWPALNEIFTKYTSGVQSKRDSLFTAFTAEEVAEQIQTFLAKAQRDNFSPDIPLWLRNKSKTVSFDRSKIRRYMVAPFDFRWIYYEPQLLGRARLTVMRHLHHGNHGLVFMRQSTNDGGYDHFLATSALVSDRVFYSAHGAPFFAPLMLSTDDGGTTPNFSAAWMEQLQDRIGTGHDRELTSRTIFHWIYAVVHSPGYRDRFAPMLCVGYPRVPWPANASQFWTAAQLGKQLESVHLSVCQAAESSHRTSGNIDLTSIPDAVKQYHIGGYPVLPRWVKQRSRRQLTDTDVAFFHCLVDVVQQTLDITDRINQTLPWTQP